MLIYTRCSEWDPPRAGSDIVTTTPEAFVAALERELLDKSLLLELQPGDGTLYRMSIAVDADRREALLACTTGRGWAAWLSLDAPVDPEGLESMAGCAINPYTAALACDVFNIWAGHAGTSIGRFYDLARSRPVEFGTRVADPEP
jgi:hypothetical protein